MERISDATLILSRSAVPCTSRSMPIANCNCLATVEREMVMSAKVEAEAEIGLSRSPRRAKRATVEYRELAMGKYSMGHSVQSMSKSLWSS